MNYRDAEDRYRIDRKFQYLVNFLEEMFAKLEFSPGEVKQAVTYASIRFERRRMPMYKIECVDGTVTEIPLAEAQRIADTPPFDIEGATSVASPRHHASVASIPIMARCPIPGCHKRIGHDRSHG